MAAARGLVRASHPAPTIAVTSAAALLGAAVGLQAGEIVIYGVAIFTGQLSIGWSNDRVDAFRDRTSGRLTKPAVTGAITLKTLECASISALAATIVFSCLLGWATATVALAGVAAGWLYNLGLKSTVFSGAAYLIAFAGLAAGPYLALPGHPAPPWWAPAAGALLGFGAHFANVLPDLRDDIATGVRGLPQRLGAHVSILVMALALGTASIVLGLGAGLSSVLGVTIVAAGVASTAIAAAVAVRQPRSPQPFYITMGVALMDVIGLIVLSR